MRSLSAGDPRVIGPYQLSALLGAGGMGRVYLGTGPDGDTAAVKVVRAEYAYDPGFRGRFARELDLVGRVHGDFTPRVLGADPVGTPPWMATEYVAGPTLHDLVRGAGALPEDSVRFLARGVAAALARVHALGTVHRDLKPGNVMVSAAGPQVIDFGVASALEDGADDEETLVAGTPGYMAPEQIDGNEVTAATDVFALGGVLAYALTGTGPFGDGHPAAVVFRISHQEPLLAGVPAGLRELLAACLARDPGTRPTAARVLEELGGPVSPAERAGAWLPPGAAAVVEEVAARTTGAVPPDGTGRQGPEAEGGPGATAATSGPGVGPTDTVTAHGSGGGAAPRGHPSPARGRALVVGAGAAALVLVAGLAAWAVVGHDGAGTEEAGADSEQTAQEPGAAGCDLPGDLAPEYVEAARDEPVVPGADTHHLDVHTFPVVGFLQGGDLVAVSHPEGIALWDTGTGEEVAYVGADLPDFAATPVLSPDGCRFGYPDAEEGVHVFDLRTGDHSRYVESLRLPGGLLEFSPDGGSLALAEGSTGEGVHIIDLESGEGTTVSEDSAEGIAYSPSGDLLAVAGSGGVVAVDTATGAEVFRGGGASTARTRNSVAFPDEDLFYYRNEEGTVPVDLASGEEAETVLAPDDAFGGFTAIAVHTGTGRLHATVERTDEESGALLPELTVWDTATGDPVPTGETPWYVRDFALHPDGSVLAVLNGDATEAALVDAETLEVILVIAESPL
ncbi:protein kinase domain-containing protein [Nocardiopsis terrae]